MIKEVKMFTVLCDRCGKDACRETDWSCWDSPEAVRDSACDGWLHVDGKDYCEGCLEWNEDESELVPKKPFKLQFHEHNITELATALLRRWSGSMLPVIVLRADQDIPNGRYSFSIDDFDFHDARLDHIVYDSKDVRHDPNRTDRLYHCRDYRVTQNIP